MACNDEFCLLVCYYIYIKHCLVALSVDASVCFLKFLEISWTHEFLLAVIGIGLIYTL